MPAETYKTSLLQDLDDIVAAAAKTDFFKTVMDDEWADRIRAEIVAMPEDEKRFSSDNGLLYFQFRHPLRREQWFRDAQGAALDGRADELDRDAKIMLGFLGVDPLIDLLPEWDRRLKALVECGIRPDAVTTKLRELRASRFMLSFRNHLFEALVLGFFAEQGVLADIEPPENPIDGVIDLDGRRILVEVTFTAQELLPKGDGVFSMSDTSLVDQAVYKIRKKAAAGKQLAKADGVPALLFLGLNWRGADDVAAQSALGACFSDPEFMKLSGVVINSGWKLRQATLFSSPSAEVPLSTREQARLQAWFDYPVLDAFGHGGAV